MSVEPGDIVTVVIKGEVRKVSEDGTGLFDVDYGPGFVVAAEGQLIDQDPFVRDLVSRARHGILWRFWDEDRKRWLCPRCKVTEIEERLARHGFICTLCSGEVEVREAESRGAWEAWDLVRDTLDKLDIDWGKQQAFLEALEKKFHDTFP